MTRMTNALVHRSFFLLLGVAGCGTEIVGYRAPPGSDAATADDTVVVPIVDAGGPVQDSGTVTPRDVPTVTDVGVVGPADVGPPSSCVSGTHWTGGTRGSAAMEPGQACITCHASRGEGPQVIGGTAYYQPNEEDNCNGFRGTGSTAAGGSYIVATDANGYTFQMAINTAGNFYYGGRTRIAFPLHAVAAVGPTGMRNEMASEPPNGDCNTCHTQNGTTTVAGGSPAPGRIVVLQ